MLHHLKSFVPLALAVFVVGILRYFARQPFAFRPMPILGSLRTGRFAPTYKLSCDGSPASHAWEGTNQPWGASLDAHTMNPINFVRRKLNVLAWRAYAFEFA